MNIWRYWTPANKQTPIARPARGAGTHPIPRFSRMARRPLSDVNHLSQATRLNDVTVRKCLEGLARLRIVPGACPSNGRDWDGSEMCRMRGGGSGRLRITSQRDPTTKQAGHFRPTPRGGVPFGPPLRRGSSMYPLHQVRHRRRCLMGAKNHAVATRPLLGQAPTSNRTSTQPTL